MQKRRVGDGIDGQLMDDYWKRDIGTHLGDEFRTEAIAGPSALGDFILAIGEYKMINCKKRQKAGSTRVSRAVPHLSTHRALSLLTSEFGWDPVHLA